VPDNQQPENEQPVNHQPENQQRENERPGDAAQGVQAQLRAAREEIRGVGDILRNALAEDDALIARAAKADGDQAR
jgi:hypothetical protein